MAHARDKHPCHQDWDGQFPPEQQQDPSRQHGGKITKPAAFVQARVLPEPERAQDKPKRRGGTQEAQQSNIRAKIVLDEER